MFNSRLKVALAFNVKPESESFSPIVPPFLNPAEATQKKSVDTYAEWDTWETISAVKKALEEFNDVQMIEADENAFEKFRQSEVDIVFNIAEGMNGISREAQIPAMLDMLKIPYTGSDPLTLATCLDKSRTKEILSYYKIPNSPFRLIEDLSQLKNIKLNFPLIVKPISEGSSKGIFSSSFVSNQKELNDEVERILKEYNQPALVEEFLPGKEFTVAILGNDQEAMALPIVEINYSEFPENIVPIYSFEAKWILDTKENPLNVFTCPAAVDKITEEKIKSTALNAFKVLHCKDWSRVDIRMNSHNEPNVIEINPLPGILPNPEENSCYPKAARTAGLNYNEMINKVLLAAARRYKLL